MGTTRRRVSTVVVLAALMQMILPAGTVFADDIYPPDAGEVVEAPPTTTGIGQFHPVAPARILDTRNGTGGITGKITGGTSRVIDVTGVGSVPASDVSAVALNVTVTGPVGTGWLTLYPAGTGKPTASSINYVAAQTIANMTVVKVGSNGNIRLYAERTTHVIFDVVGWYHASTPAQDHVGATLFRSLTPARILDTRFGTGGVSGRIAAGTSKLIDVTGVGGVPGTNVAAVALNVTVTGSTGGGFLTLYPSGTTRPTTSNVNWAGGQTIANMAVMKVGADGKIRVYASQATHVIFDVVGWYAPGDPDTGGEMSPLNPKRILDTRFGTGGVTGRIVGGTTKTIDVTGVGGIPATGVSAVVLNVTVTGATKSGWLTLYPSGAAKPNASNVNYVAGQTIAAMAIVKVGGDGKIRLFAQGTTHVIFDAIGFYASPGSDPAGDTTAAAADRLALTTSDSLPPGLAESDANASSSFTVTDPRRFSDAIAEDGPPVGLDVEAGGAGFEPAHPGLVISGPFFHTDDGKYVGGDPRIGRIYFKKTAGAGWSYCSGTVVARNLVLTAGHCVADPQFFAEWYFIPGLNGSLTTAINTYGSWTATNVVVGELWTVHGNSAADWAYLVFGNVPANGNAYIGDYTGVFGIHADPPGGTKLSYGYPGEGWFASNDFQTCSHDWCVPYECTARVTDSNTQYLKTRDDPAVSYGGWYEVGFGCWSTGGASGGPVFQLIDGGWWVTGVNSHVQTDSNGVFACASPTGVCRSYARNLWSPYFNSDVIQKWFDNRVP